MTTDLHSRYGGRSPHAAVSSRKRLSRRAIIGIAAALAAASGVAAWYGLAPSANPDGTRTLSYDVVDSSLTTASIAVIPDETRDIVCAVRAVNEQEATVGFAEIMIPADPAAGPEDPVTVHTEIATTQLASSGHHQACWYADDEDPPA